MRNIILSGRSGSGKTVALRALEDQGFYCVDNIPISLIPQLVEACHSLEDGLALGVDARSMSDDLSEFSNILKKVNEKGTPFEVYFIDADNATILKRYSETRRRHPLTQSGLSLKEAIAKERELLEPIALCADLRIDSTSMTPYALRDFIQDKSRNVQTSSMEILFESFGFKHGIPTDADFVFDARCLPNPYWEPSLREHHGKEQKIIDFLEEKPYVHEYFWQIKTFLHTWMPRFEQDKRSYLTIAIGCTGGFHRSVFLAEKLKETFSPDYPNVQIRHRDLKT